MGAAALWVLGVIATLWLRKPADSVPAEPEHRALADEGATAP
jgi:DHA2 family lincomycin resistance protein-like MFS transporter